MRDPQINISGDVITVKGVPENSPSAKFGDQVCESNLLRAKTTQRNIAINLVYWDAGNKTTDTRPDDVILGTNGWWCLSDFRFDRESQQIIVKVGNAHFDEYGNEIQGWMELKVKGKRAREWWGIDPAIAAGYAKVQISYPDGSSKIATVTSVYDPKMIGSIYAPMDLLTPHRNWRSALKCLSKPPRSLNQRKRLLHVLKVNLPRRSVVSSLNALLGIRRSKYFFCCALYVRHTFPMITQ